MTIPNIEETDNSREIEDVRIKLLNILAFQAVITAQGENYTGEKDWALNKLTELLHNSIFKE